jgi:hypothetical protein
MTADLLIQFERRDSEKKITGMPFLDGLEFVVVFVG